MNRTLIIVGSRSYRDFVERQARPSPLLRVAVPGTSLAGHRFDTIIITEEYRVQRNRCSPLEITDWDRWMDDVVLCRRTVEGSIIHL